MVAGKILKKSVLIITFILLCSSLFNPIASSISSIKPNLDGYGPCPINGIVGNGNLTVGVDEKGTIILFSWPKAGFYDHVNYLTISEDMSNNGVKNNMGIFSGIIYTECGQKKLSWLKSEDWEHSQYYQNDESNVLVTEFKNSELNIKVKIFMFVLINEDVLLQHFDMELLDNCTVSDIQLLFFENFNICDYRLDGFPISDWLLDFFNDYGVLYDKEIDGICHYKPEKLIDRNLRSNKNKGIYITASGSSKPISYQCGKEYFDFGLFKDAYADSLDADLSMNEKARGKVDSAMIFSLDFNKSKANFTLYFSASKYQENSKNILQDAKEISYTQHLSDTNNWWKNWISEAILPKNAPNLVREISKRSLILIRTCYDSKTGAIIASPSRQAPYSADWPRDGAFINYALDLAGYSEMVEKHNYFYKEVQKPIGRWSMCYYSDGVLAGPIPFEIDQIGYAMWGLHEHYEFTKDIDYLNEVYPSIKKSAMLLTYWRDPITKLHLPAFEDDSWIPKQTLRGAANVLLGLKSAIKAGKIIGEDQKIIDKWQNRAKELEKAIDKYFWIEDYHYSDPRGGGSTILWPMNFKDYNSSIMTSQINYLYDFLLIGQNGTHSHYGYDLKTLASLAYVWKNDTRLMDLMDWFSDIATPGTYFFGERFRIGNTDGDINYENYVSLPHIWTHALYFISAMFIYC